VLTNRISGLLLSAIALAAPGFAQATADSVAPEGASDGQVQALTDELIAALEAKTSGVPVQSGKWMVAAANPLAVEAGAKILRAGGSAADAMVAVQVVLGLAGSCLASLVANTAARLPRIPCPKGSRCSRVNA